MFDIDPKKFGIDTAKIADMVDRADATTKRIDWLSQVAVSVVKQIAARFHFDLPPEP